MTALRRVLIADDVPDIRFLMRMALERSGHFAVVAEAGDGQAAIDCAREHQPDVVILDLSMPVLDGLEALPLIREAASGAQVVVVSGFAASRMREQAIAAGAVDYIEKGNIFDVVKSIEALSAN